MILFLDDDSSRVVKFLDVVRKANYAFSAPSMIGQLAACQYGKIKVEALFLDHDLGGETFVDPSSENCGMAVVRWMVEHKPEVERVFIHSLNVPAAMRMEQDLLAAGYWVRRTPFIQIDWEKVKHLYGDK